MNNHSGPTKQTKETARLGARLRRRRGAGDTWEEAARKERVFKKDNISPDPGLAYRIACDGYEPKGQELRDRLGLRKICLACMRGFRKISSRAKALSPWRLWWRRLKPGEREKRIKSQYEQENQR